MKYLKTIGIIFIPILLLSLIYTSLYYFDIINYNILKIINFITIIISLFIGNTYLGKNTKSKGYLEGIKIGTSISIMFFLISYLGYNKFRLINLLYYILIILVSMSGSIYGIRNIKVDNK